MSPIFGHEIDAVRDRVPWSINAKGLAVEYDFSFVGFFDTEDRAALIRFLQSAAKAD